MKNIGFIGLGAMGSAMAPLLVKAGYKVFGFDIKNTMSDDYGIINVKSINLLSDKDVIIFMLPSGKEVTNTATILSDLRTNSIMIDMSSSHPEDTIKLGKKLKRIS